MKQLAKIAVFYIVLLSASAFGSTPNPGDQFDLIQGGIPAKVGVTQQEIKAMDTSIDQLLRRTGGLLTKDADLERDLKATKEELGRLKEELGKVVKPGDLTVIRVDLGRLWTQVNNHGQRLTELEQDVEDLKRSDKAQDDRLGDHDQKIEDINKRLDRGLGVKFGIGAYGVYGTQGSINGGASARLRIPLYGGWQAIVSGGVGGNHQGASGFADLSVGYQFASGVYLGATLGIDANCDGMCTRLLTEIWGAGPDIGYLSDDGLFIRARVLLGSEWIKGPTMQIEYPDRTVFKTDDSRDFGLSALLQLGHEF